MMLLISPAVFRSKFVEILVGSPFVVDGHLTEDLFEKILAMQKHIAKYDDLPRVAGSLP